MDYAEDGNLQKHNDARLGGSVGLNGDQAVKFVKAMVEACWLDRKPYFRVHDWWDYIGRFLQTKYKHYPEKWQRIKKLYEKNGNSKQRLKEPPKELFLDYVPNQPNQPNQPKSLSSDSVEIGLSELLFSLIRGRNPTCKEPNMQAWARNIDLMIRIDHRDPDEIRELIQLCQKDSFWQNNILSTEKLRKQYDQLKLKLMPLKGQEPRIPPECSGCKKEQCKRCEYEGKWA